MEKNKTNKVGFLISDLESGGAQKVICTLSDYFNSIGIESDLIVFSLKNQFFFPKSKLINLEIDLSSNLFLRLMNIFKRYIKLLNIKKKNQYSVVVSFLEAPNFYNAITKMNNTRVFTSIRNYKQTGLVSRGIFLKLMIYLSDHVILPSDDMKNLITKRYNIHESKVTVIHNPISNINYSKIKSGLIPEDKKPFILSVGRLEKQKAQWLLIDAFKLLKERIDGINLIILGEGTLRSKLEQQIIKNGLHDSVFLKGKVDNVNDYYQNCAVLVQTSLHEGFPNVILEGLSFGTAIVSTNCPYGPKEILAPGLNVVKNHDFFKSNKSNYGVLIDFDDYSIKRLSNLDKSKEIRMISDMLYKLLSNQTILEFYQRQSLIRSNDYKLEKIAMDWLNVINGF